MAIKRVVVGLGVIALGVCAALPFRREPPGLATAPTKAQTSADISATPLLAAPRNASPKKDAGLSPVSPYIDDGSPHQGRSKPPAAKTASRAAAFEEATPEPPAGERTVAVPMLPLSFQVKQLEESQAWKPAEVSREAIFAAPPREYRIRKLDSLENLAERFLGSKNHARDIFEANRDVLSDPNILPLGAVIRIPARTERATGPPAANGDLVPLDK